MTMFIAILFCLLAPNLRCAVATQEEHWEESAPSYTPTGSDDGYQAASEYEGGNDAVGYSEGGYAAQGWDMERPVKTVVRHVVKNIAVPHPVPAPVHVPVPKYVKFFKPFAIARPVAVPHVIPVIKHIQKPLPFFTAIPVQRTVPVPKFIGLPVQVRVPKPVFIHVPKIVPVAKRYPVPITVNIPKPYIVPIFKSVPVPVPHKVPKIINIVKEVPHYVKKPIPVYVDAHSSSNYDTNSYSSSGYTNHYPENYGGGYENSQEDPYGSYTPVQTFQKEQEYDGHSSDSQSQTDSQGNEYETPYFYDRPRYQHQFLNGQLRAHRLPNRVVESPIDPQYLQHHNTTAKQRPTYNLNVEVTSGESTPGYGESSAPATHESQNMASQVYYNQGNQPVNNPSQQFVASTPSTQFSQPVYSPAPYAEYTVNQEDPKFPPAYTLEDNATVSQYFTSGAAPTGQNMVAEPSKSMHYYSQPNGFVYSQNSETYNLQEPHYSSSHGMSPSASSSNYGYEEMIYKPNNEANSFKSFTHEWPSGYVRYQSIPNKSRKIKHKNGSQMSQKYAQQHNPQMIQQFAQQNAPQMDQLQSQQIVHHQNNPQVVHQVMQESIPQMTQQYTHQMASLTETFDQLGNSVMQKTYRSPNMQSDGYFEMMQQSAPSDTINSYVSSMPSSNSYTDGNFDQVPNAAHQIAHYENLKAEHRFSQSTQQHGYPSQSKRRDFENNYQPSGSHSESYFNSPQGSSQGDAPITTTYYKPPIQKSHKNMGVGHKNAEQVSKLGENPISISNVKPPVQKSRNHFINPNTAEHSPNQRMKYPITATVKRPPIKEDYKNVGYPQGYQKQIKREEERPTAITHTRPAVQEVHRHIDYPQGYVEQKSRILEQTNSKGEKPIATYSIPAMQMRYNQNKRKPSGSQATKDGVSKILSPISTSHSDSSLSNSHNMSPETLHQSQNAGSIPGLTINTEINDSQPQPAYSPSVQHATNSDYGYDSETKEKLPTFAVVDSGMNSGQFQHFAYSKNDKLQSPDEDSLTTAIKSESILTAFLMDSDKPSESIINEQVPVKDDMEPGDSGKDMHGAFSSIINVYTNSPFGKAGKNGHSYSFINPEEIASSLSASNQPETDEEATKKEFTNADIRIMGAIAQNKDEPLQTSLAAYAPDDTTGEKNAVYKMAKSDSEPVYHQAVNL